jgi:hypothetical protein
MTLLVPGGGNPVHDCLAEWMIANRAIEPPPTTSVSCTDGDPACDADGVTNDLCVFRVGLCLGGTDPKLPECPQAAGLKSFILQSPQPAAANPIDAANAVGLITAVGDLVGATPGGAGGNSFTFEPPLVLTPPLHCTAPAAITVERRGLALRSERFRARAIGVATDGDLVDDPDALLLTCTVPGG